MINLEIEFEEEITEDIIVCVDESIIDFQISYNKLVAELTLDIGIHLLSIKLKNSRKVSIKDVLVNQTSVRQFLYLSWVEENKTKIQPCTDLWNSNQVWNIPISNPMSLLVSTAFEKFTDSDLGTNLYEKYDIYYPESVIINDSFPVLVKDFFKYNFDFHLHPKASVRNLFGNEQVPYFQFDYKYNEIEIYNELQNNIDYLLSYEKIPAQHRYNNSSDQKRWRTIFPYPYNNGVVQNVDDFILDKIKLPILYEFYKSLPIENIYLSFLGLLPAGGYIAPHKDFSNNDIPAGCRQLYFAVNGKSGNYLKIHNVGLVPYCDRPTVLNNQSFTHSLVNQSNEPRWIIAVVGNLSDKFIKGLENA